MKKNIVLSLAVLPFAALLIVVGCGKKEDPAAPSTGGSKPAESSSAPVQRAATDVKEAVQQTAQDVAQKVGAESDKIKNQVQEQVQATKDQGAATADTLKAQALIEQASKLVANTKYAEAADLLKQVANYKLSPDQQKLVDDLGAKIKTGLAGSATKAVGDLLNAPK